MLRLKAAADVFQNGKEKEEKAAAAEESGFCGEEQVDVMHFRWQDASFGEKAMGFDLKIIESDT